MVGVGGCSSLKAVTPEGGPNAIQGLKEMRSTGGSPFLTRDKYWQEPPAVSEVTVTEETYEKPSGSSGAVLRRGDKIEGVRDGIDCDGKPFKGRKTAITVTKDIGGEKSAADSKGDLELIRKVVRTTTETTTGKVHHIQGMAPAEPVAQIVEHGIDAAGNYFGLKALRPDENNIKTEGGDAQQSQGQFQEQEQEQEQKQKQKAEAEAEARAKAEAEAEAKAKGGDANATNKNTFNFGDKGGHDGHDCKDKSCERPIGGNTWNKTKEISHRK